MSFNWRMHLNKIKSLLKEFKDLAKDLEVGVSISDEDYQKLISIMPEAENHFVNSIDGKMYIGGLDVEKAITEAFDPTKNKEVIDSAVGRLDEWGAAGIEGQTDFSNRAAPQDVHSMSWIQGYEPVPLNPFRQK